jgi:hypothetical protein
VCGAPEQSPVPAAGEWTEEMLLKERTPRCVLTAALAAGSLLVMAGPGWAATESGDAGDLPASAQEVNDTSISGTIASSNDEDMYKVCLSGGQTFSATTVGGASFDTQLFLFDANGHGVYGNDDTEGLASTLPSGHALTPAAAGTYYLAISSYNREPVSAGGAIFHQSSSGIVEPTGPGGGSPISGWIGGFSQGSYTITLTGVVACAPADWFLAPIDNDALNVLKAGQGMPVKFSLGGDQGLAILAAGSPTSRQVQCDSSLPPDPVEQTVTAGASGLSYDAATDVYTYTWKTDKAWAGTCRELTVTLIDGTSHSALFMFSR